MIRSSSFSSSSCASSVTSDVELDMEDELFSFSPPVQEVAECVFAAMTSLGPGLRLLANHVIGAIDGRADIPVEDANPADINDQRGDFRFALPVPGFIHVDHVVYQCDRGLEEIIALEVRDASNRLVLTLGTLDPVYDNQTDEAGESGDDSGNSSDSSDSSDTDSVSGNVRPASGLLVPHVNVSAVSLAASLRQMHMQSRSPSASPSSPSSSLPPPSGLLAPDQGLLKRNRSSVSIGNQDTDVKRRNVSLKIPSVKDIPMPDRIVVKTEMSSDSDLSEPDDDFEEKYGGDISTDAFYSTKKKASVSNLSVTAPKSESGVSVSGTDSDDELSELDDDAVNALDAAFDNPAHNKNVIPARSGQDKSSATAIMRRYAIQEDPVVRKPEAKIAGYENILLLPAARAAIARLPAKQRNAATLYRALHSTSSNAVASVAGGLKHASAFNKLDIVKLTTNFITFARAEAAMSSADAEETDLQGRKYVGALRHAIFPVPPATAAALADVRSGKKQVWNNMSDASRTRARGIWGEFDVYLASREISLAALLTGPQARKNFIMEKRRFCALHPGSNEVKSAMRLWRTARYPMQLDSIILFHLQPVQAERMEGLVSELGEYACVHGMADDDFVDYVRHAHLSDKEKTLADWTGTPGMTGELLSLLRDKESTHHLTAMQLAVLDAIKKSFPAEWKELPENVKGRFLNVWEAFATYLEKKEISLTELIGDTGRAAEFVMLGQQFMALSKSAMSQRGPMRFLRAAAFPRELDKTLHEKVSQFPNLNERSMDALQGIASDFVDYHIVHGNGIDDDTFLSQLEDQKIPEVTSALCNWTGSAVLTERLLNHLRNIKALASGSQNAHANSAAAALAAIGEQTWEQCRSQKQYLAVWSDFDQFLRSKGTSVSKLLAGPDAAVNFMKLQQAFPVQSKNATVRPAMQAWRMAQFPLPLDRTLASLAETMPLSDNFRKIFKTLLMGGLAEYAKIHCPDDQTFLQQLNGGPGGGAELNKKIRNWCKFAETQINTLIYQCRGHVVGRR